VLFGDVAPAGRLTQTWYASADDLPDILEYDIIKANRTYWYFEGRPLYPFGHGLTYTTFEYRNLRLSADAIDADGQADVSVEIANTGSRASDEVVQMYVHARQSRVKRPIKELKGFTRVNVQPGETQMMRFTLPASELAFWDVTRDRFVVESGEYDILVGRSSADIRLTAVLTVHGETIPPRRLTVPTRAENYDDYHGIRLVDETQASGTAVGSHEPGGWIAFRDVDFGSGVDRFVASVAKGDAGNARIEVRLDGADGTLIGAGDVSATGDRYNWLTTTIDVSRVTGIHTVCLVLRGGLRIRSFYFQSRS
jgi:beta-glucosidase